MADNILNVTVFDVRPKATGGAWVNGSVYMGKDKQTGAYNDGMWVSLHFPSTYPITKGERVSVTCKGLGWDCYTPPATGIERKTPKFHVTDWHAQHQSNQSQQHPPTSSYQNQWNVPF